MHKRIGFIGQGWIGKNYADNFEERGFETVRYALEEPYIKNEEKIKECDIVFIAVPTPTTPNGFDDGIIRKVIKLVGRGKTAVIKSTILPGTTESIQEENPDIFVMHSPEFLTRGTAKHDAAHPDRNIIGVPKDNEEYKVKAREVMEVLPRAPFRKICVSRDAELIKYGGNCFFYFKNIFFNMLYDLAVKFNCDWDEAQMMITADPRIGSVHTSPVHDSGRGAGGDCLIKDFASFIRAYEKLVGDKEGVELLKSMEKKNIKYLSESKKDLGLLTGVYGEEIANEL